MKRIIPLLVAVLFLAACAANPSHVADAGAMHAGEGGAEHGVTHHPEGYEGHAAHHADDDAGHEGHTMHATAGPGYTVADVHFMQMMIGHHAQAIVMSQMAEERGASEPVLRLAQKIDISQRDEIDLMATWLAQRDQEVPDSAQIAAMWMPGMLTDEQMDDLAAARGQEFDQLFLSLMIVHHEGAIDMVDELFESPGSGQDPDLFRFVTDVTADQGDEIFVMARMLESLAASTIP